jgi:hypothetical protein
MDDNKKATKVNPNQKLAKRTVPKAKPSIPQKWPKDLWQRCWNGHYIDFTNNQWAQLSNTERLQYASNYQRWYATKKGLPVEKTFHKAGANFVMRLIPPGKFSMGSAETEKYRKNDENKHNVTLSKAYWMQKTELTQRQWRTVTGETPWRGQKYATNNDRHPVMYISWGDVYMKFLKKTRKRI